MPRRVSGMNTASTAFARSTLSSHLRVPSAAAVSPTIARRLDHAFAASFSRSASREIGHLREVGRAALVDPAQHLAGAERLLALRFEEARQPRRVKLEQVLFIVHPGKKKAISLRAVSGPSEPCTALASIESAKSARIVPLAAFFGSVAPISSRLLGDGVLALEHLHHHRPGDHEIDKVLEERALAVHRVEAFGLLARQMRHARRDDAQARRLEAREDLADDILLDRVGLDDREGPLYRH